MHDILEQLELKRAAAHLGGGQKRIDAGLKQSFKNNPAVRDQLPQLTIAVQSGKVAASTAARNLLAVAAERT